MRAVLAIIVGLACPLTAAAQTAGDRYGPAPAARPSQVAAATYQGPMLSWANKRPLVKNAAVAPASSPQQPAYTPFTPQVPLPLQPRAAAPAPQVQRSQVQTPQVQAPQVRPQAQTTAKAPPASIYSEPPPSGRAPAQPQPAPPQAPPPPQAQTARPAASPRPAQQVQAQPQSAQPRAQAQVPPQAQVSAPQARPPQRVAALVQPGMGGAPRLYSVHRGYGMTPDAIPEPPAGNRYVLIGPPDAPPSAKTDDDDAPDACPGAF